MSNDQRLSRRRGLVVVAVLFCQTCFALGTVKSMGVFLTGLNVSLHTTATGTGVALGLFSGFINFPSPLVAFINRRWFVHSPRWLIVGGATLASLGVILSSLAINNVHFCLCLVTAGFGHSLLSVSSCLVLNDIVKATDFDLLYSIGKSGYAFGMVLVPLLADFLFHEFGWRGATLILGAIMANLIPCSLAIKTNPRDEKKSFIDAAVKSQEASPLDISVECPDRISSQICINGNVIYLGAVNADLDKDLGRYDVETCWTGRVELPSHTDGLNDDQCSGSSERDALRHIPTTTSNTRSSGVTTEQLYPIVNVLSRTDNGQKSSMFATQIGCSEQDRLNPSILISTTKHCGIEGTMSISNVADGTESEINASTIQQLERVDIDGVESKDAHHCWIRRKYHAFKKTEFFTDPCLTLIVFTNIPFGVVYGGWHAFLIPRALAHGSSVLDILVVTCAAAAAYFFGRISVGVLSRRYLSAQKLFLILTAVNIASILVDVFLHHFIVLVMASFSSALSIAGRTILEVLIAKGRTQKKRFPVILTAHELLIGIGILLGGYLSGLMADVFGDFDASFKMLLGVDIVVLLLMTITTCKRRTSRRPDVMDL